jgi:hypothetical protein
MKVKIKDRLDSRKTWVIELLEKQEKDGYLIANKIGNLYHVEGYVFGEEWIEEV